MKSLMNMALVVLAVTLLASGCTDAKTVTVPNLVGESEDSAKQLVEQRELIFSSTKEYDGDVSKGDVISQDPSKGATVSAGSEIEAVISKGIGRRSIGDELEEVNTGGGWETRCTAPWMGDSCPHSAYH